MSSTVPTATTLYNYDPPQPRHKQRQPAGSRDHAQQPAQPGAGHGVPVRELANARARHRTHVEWYGHVDIWSATNAAAAGRTGSLIAYLRDYNPATGTYVEIANATRTAAYAAGRTYYETPILVTVAPAYTLATGHMLEVKIESPTATSQNNMLVAYDTTTDSSLVRVR
jgi:hypothetical protein